jgi:hypothetical protein
MRQPMPSPRGTNLARLFITTNPRGAYDAALSEESGAELVSFLQGKLSEEDLAEFCKLAGIDAGLGMDARRRRPAMDAASTADFARRHPHAARIKVSL